MRSLILITTYLSKDILKRWLETPGAVFARLLIAVSLCLLYLFINAGFLLTENVLNKKIEGLGVNTMLLRAPSANSDVVRVSLAELLSSLESQGLFLPLSLSYVNARLTSGKDARTIIYDDQALPALSQLFENFDRIKGPIFLAAHGYPDAMVTRVDVKGHYLDAEVVRPPSVFRFVSRNAPLLFIPRSLAGPLNEYSMQESVLFLAENANLLPEVISATELLLEAEGFKHYETISPIQWMGELDDIRVMRTQAQGIAGTFAGLLIVLIFGSIAIFEYRQNIYTTALFKSFGLPTFHLIIRYAVDGLLILLFSFGIALSLAHGFHGTVFHVVGFDSSFLLLDQFNPYLLSDNLYLLLVLLISSVAGVVPVCLALRRPVGRVLG
jgi:hypothetical protein